MKSPTAWTLLAFAALSLACSAGEDTLEPTPEPVAEATKAVDPPKDLKGQKLNPGRMAPMAGGPLGVRGPKLGPGAKGPGSGSRFQQVKRTCCTNGRVNRLLDRYLDLQEAMVSGKDTAAAWDKLHSTALDAEKEGALEASSLAAVQAIAKAAEGAGSQELKQQQALFSELYKPMAQLVDNHGGGARPIGPAMDPQSELRWFQREGKPQNPVGGQRAVYVE